MDTKDPQIETAMQLLAALRVGAVVAPNWQDKPRKAGSFTWGPFADLARVMEADVIAGLLAALNSAARPGMHLYNLVGPDVAADDPVVPVVRGLAGPAADVDTRWYARDGHQFDSVYDLRKTASELGFMPGEIHFNFSLAHEKLLTTLYPCFIGPHALQAGVIRLITDGRLNVSPLVSHTTPWRNSPSVYNGLFTADRTNINGIVIDWRDA